MSNFSRRSFLASAAVATASAARLSAAEDARLRVGFIGVGNRGTALLRNFLDAKLGDVVAVCDIKDEHAKRAATLKPEGRGEQPETRPRSVRGEREEPESPVATVEHGRDAVLACLLVREAVYRKQPVTMKELKG